MADVTVNIRDDGPLLVQGPCVLKDQAGNIVRESDNMVALCRCGLSNSKPMCDGSHAGSGLGPRIFTASEDGFIAFCGCKRSADATGKCDGTHSTF